MADAAAARREARKKRILENSLNRLDLIAGKKSSEDCSQDSSKYSYSEQVYDSLTASSSRSISHSPSVNNGTISPPPDTFTLLSESINPIAAGDTQVVNDLTNLAFPSSDNIKQKSRLEKLVTYKYDVVLLALLNQFLYTMFIFETTYFFLPLVIYTVTKLIWFPGQSNSNFANVFLLMNGISANKAMKIMIVFKWFAEITQDICVYLFITISVQSLLIFLNNYIVVT